MLTKISIEGFGDYVCGRKRPAAPPSLPPFTAETARYAATFSDVNSLRKAAESLHPIYATMGNILGNDKWGVCAVVAALKIQAIIDCATDLTWRAPSLDDVLRLYKIFNPDFNPQTGAGDDGCQLEDVLNHWISKGLYPDGHGKIKGAYAVDASKTENVHAALKATGLLYVGCDLPKAWPDQVKPSFTWGVEGPPEPDMGHATLWYGGNDNGVFDSTWGFEGTILGAAVGKYFSPPTGEVYAIIPA